MASNYVIGYAKDLRMQGWHDQPAVENLLLRTTIDTIEWFAMRNKRLFFVTLSKKEG